MPLTAFVSYARKDKHVLHEIVRPVLESLDVEVKTDECIPVGERWLSWVQERIERDHWLIVMLTEAYQEQMTEGFGACYNELHWIVDHVATARHPPTLVTVLASGSLPKLLKTYQAIDIKRGSDGLRPALRQLAQSQTVGTTVSSPDPGDDEVELEYPTVDSPDKLTYLARYNFNRMARDYNATLMAGNAMQAENATRLLKVIAEHRAIDPRPLNAWLDAGCGTGLVANVAQQRRKEHGLKIHRAGIRGAFDYAPGMLSLCKRDRAANYTHVFKADLLTIDPHTVQRELESDTTTVDLVIANNVLHWLYSPGSIELALKNCYRLLNLGGLLAADIAAAGTGYHFFKAYHTVISEKLSQDEQQRWGNQLHFLENPIGLQSLDSIVAAARRAGFAVKLAELRYEPRTYNNTDDYISDARGYGDDVLEAPIRLMSRAAKKDIWSAIARRFAASCEEDFGTSGPYEHDQYIVYLLAQRMDE